MTIASGFLFAVLGLSAALLVWGGKALFGLLLILAAAGMAFALTGLAPRHAERFAGAVRGPGIVIGALGAFCLLQILPQPILVHPVWLSVSAALERPVMGSITIDAGATLFGALQIGALLVVFCLAAAVATERLRARALLHGLVALSGFVATVALAARFAPGLGLQALAGAQAQACLPAAVVIATAGLVDVAMLRRFEREIHQETRHRVVAPFCLAVMLLALVAGLSSDGVLFPLMAMAGSTLLVAPLVARVFNLGLPGFLALVASVAIAGIALAQTGGLATAEKLRGMDAVARMTDPVQQVIRDAPWLGTGLGTFDDIAMLYRLPGEPEGGLDQASAFVRLAVELGLPMLLALAACVLAAAGYLAWGALQRGRDQVFPAAGAGVMAALLLEAIVAPATTGLFPALLVALAGGLGFAQASTRSRVERA